jgi:hypothetical protein
VQIHLFTSPLDDIKILSHGAALPQPLKPARCVHVRKPSHSLSLLVKSTYATPYTMCPHGALQLPLPKRYVALPCCIAASCFPSQSHTSSSWDLSSISQIDEVSKKFSAHPCLGHQRPCSTWWSKRCTACVGVPHLLSSSP